MTGIISVSLFFLLLVLGSILSAAYGEIEAVHLFVRKLQGFELVVLENIETHKFIKTYVRVMPVSGLKFVYLYPCKDCKNIELKNDFTAEYIEKDPWGKIHTRSQYRWKYL